MESDKMIDISKSIKVLTWNRRFLSMMGVWPEKVYDSLFIPIFTYLFVHCTLTIIDLHNYSRDINKIIANLTELTVFVNTLVKLTICRLRKDSLEQFLMDIKNDFTVENYRSKKEMIVFYNYNRLAYLFTVIAVPCKSLSTLTYFFRTLMANTQMVINNSSFGYHLPYKTQTVIEINDGTTYAVFCTYQMLVLPVLIFGSVGCDAFFITLALHVTAQLSVLKRRVKGAFEDPDGCRCGMKKLINSHYRLIRLIDTLEDIFNVGILQYLLGTTFTICCSGYQAMLFSASGQIVKLFPFFVFTAIVLGTLFIYCYTGECLMQESMDFGLAFYKYEWYNFSPLDLKFVYICMIRASRPLQLTAGKFFVLSICTFTDILKTAVGYISVLRALTLG